MLGTSAARKPVAESRFACGNSLDGYSVNFIV